MGPISDVPSSAPLDSEVDDVWRSLPADSRWRRAGATELAPLPNRRQAMLTDSLTNDDLRQGGSIDVEERCIPGPPGAPAIPTLILRPTDHTGPWPCIYFLHGSGMVMPGNRTMLTVEELGWVATLGAMLVSIDYRVAPENPHPAPVEDCYAGLEWTAGHAAELGADPDRLILAGSSAGGGLAAATALMSRDRQWPPVSHQVLICPMLDDREATVSSRFDAIVWNRQSNRMGWTALLGEARGGEEVSPYAAPARAHDLSGLPPAYLDCGSSELFRDETMDYATRLAGAGVPVELHVWSGAAHYTERMAPEAHVTRAAIAARSSYLRRALRSRCRRQQEHGLLQHAHVSGLDAGQPDRGSDESERS